MIPRTVAPTATRPARYLQPRWAVLLMAVPALLAAACGAQASSRGAQHRATTTSAPSTSQPVSSPSTSPSTVPSPTAHRPSGTSWLTYGGSFTRVAVDAADPSLTHVPSTVWTSPTLDGAVYGQPLSLDGLTFVGTENDTVYALSDGTGSVVWSVHLGTPVPSNVLPCGDITPTVGITSTMVIDPVTRTLFVSAALWSGADVGHSVMGIDLTTHKITWDRDVDQPGWIPAAELQRTALALSAGRVIVGFGGNYGDCGDYNGWVVGVPESGNGALITYKVPAAREGAVWAPAGVAVDESGDLFAATGNGSAGAGQAFDHGNSVIKLSPTLGEIGYFAPLNWAAANASDADLGSTAPLLLGASRAFIVGKQATAFLLDVDTLGGVGGQKASLPLCNSRGGNAYAAPEVYVVCPDDGTIDEVRVGPGDTLSRGWVWRSPSGAAGSPTLADGWLWTVDPSASVLYAIDPGSGTTHAALALRTGTPPHFVAPAPAGRLVVVAGSQAVEAVG